MDQGRDYDEPSPGMEKFSEDKVIPSALDVEELSTRSLAVQDPVLTARGLTFDEDTAGGMGRHMGVFSCTMLIVGSIIGTGIFSTPSSILGSVGSVGASLMLWVLGFVLASSGLLVWLEYGTMFPRSGGEKVYLEEVYQTPRYLATAIFAIHVLLLGFSASGCISLSLIKVFLLLFVVVSGLVVLSGHTRVQEPHANFRDAFAGSSRSSGDYATAMFKVINAYGGWSNLNYILNDVKNPVRTLKIAGPLGLGICAGLYLLANIGYFAASTKDEIINSGVTVASLFFKNVFGVQAQRALSAFVALSALGNTITVTFTSSRLYQELAKSGVPLPFGNRFWASNWPTGQSPLPGLILHLIPTIIVIIAPPYRVVYPFILNVKGYPSQIINLFIIIGLFWLRYSRPNAIRPFKVWWPVGIFYLACVFFLIIAPFLPLKMESEIPLLYHTTYTAWLA
ncbi:hypothetical protein PTI98_008379 [Pleurotus ostreatus]|nr:hypothetical protein PTI98_008379 [Pleurotus ostreatus]